MAYKIEIRPTALEFIQKQSQKHRKQIASKIDSLEREPRPPNAKQLQGYPELWRIRSGDFRIIYTIKHKVLLVTVVSVGHRKDVYDRLKRLLEK